MTARRLEILLVLPLVLLLVLVLPSLLVAGAAAFGAATTSVRSRPPSALALAGRATHYDVLGASRGASAAVLKERYRALARRTHPDAAPARAGGEAAYDFHDVSSAWRVLGDERERRRYDRSLMGEEVVEAAEALMDRMGDAAGIAAGLVGAALTLPGAAFQAGEDARAALSGLGRAFHRAFEESSRVHRHAARYPVGLRR